MSSYDTFSDEELIDFLKKDNQAALKALMTRYWDKLLSVALKRLHNLQEAEECVQDVFYNLWKKREYLELKYTLATYLAVAVKYQVLDLLDKQYRKAKHVAKQESNAAESSSPSAEEYLLEKELFLQLEKTIKSLPEKCQIVYRMSREQGRNNKEIAAELNIAEKTVEAHLTKAIKDIRNNMTTAALPLFVMWLGDLHNKL